VFLGSGEFAVPIAIRLAAHPVVDLQAVVTAPPRPSGRGRALKASPVGEWADRDAIPTLSPPRLRDAGAVADVAALAPDLLVLADYGQIVPAQLLALPRHGALNLHPSLLPRHRGASPIPAAILAGDGETGVTLMLMDAGLDTGPIVTQRRLPLDGSETAPGLEGRLAGMAADLLADQLEAWLDGALAAQPQPDDGVTVTRPLRREDGRLDPSRSALELERQIRAYQPWPGSFVDTSQGRIIVWRARPLSGTGGEGTPGTLVDLGRRGLALVAADGMLELVEVQPGGRGRMTGDELLRGRPSLAGTTVVSRPEPAPSSKGTMS